MKKILILLLTLTLLLCALPSCSGGLGSVIYDTSLTGAGADVDMSRVAQEINSRKIKHFKKTSEVSDYIVFDIEDYGKIALVVREDIAPITAKNFKSLVAKGHYNGLTFHRVISYFMIQGGGYDESGKLHSAPTIIGEFATNKVTNNLLHIKGVLSLARAKPNNSGSAQFFIMTGENSDLDGKYAAFGYVLAGMDVVEKIANCEVDYPYSSAPKPVDPVVIKEAYFAKYVG